MKIVNVPGAGPLSFPDSESDDSIYAKIAKIQEHLRQVDLATRPDPRDIPVGRVASNAFSRMGRGLGITAFNEAPALAASLFGADDTARRLLDEAKTERQALEEKYPTSQRSFEGIRGLSDFGKFLVESGVEAIPPVAAIAGTGGIGALAGRGVARYGMEAAAARAAAQRGVGVEAAEAAAAAARSKAGQTGLNVGLGTGSFGLNAPETFAGIYEETDKLEPGLAMGAGAFKALFDGLLPARVLNQLGLRGQAKLAEEIASRSTIVPDSFKLRLAKEIGKTAATESGTEVLQEATDIIAEQLAGAPGGFSNPKNVDRLLMAAAKGGIGGAAIGAPGAVVQTMRETPAKEPELPLNETKKAGSVGPGPAENLAAAMQKRKAQEAITEDEFQLLVQNGVLKDNPQTRASVKFAAPTVDADQAAAAATLDTLQQQQQQNQQQGDPYFSRWKTETLLRNLEREQGLDPANQRAQWIARLQREIDLRRANAPATETAPVTETPADVNQQLNEAAVADQQGQNDQVRVDALKQAEEINQQRQAREVAEYQGKRQAEAEAQIQQAQQQAQQNVQPNTQSESTPPPNVTTPSGESAGVPSGPQGGLPPTGVTTPPPPRVATTERPVQQTQVGERTQPPTVTQGKQAVWSNKDTDIPVTVIGEPETMDGKQFVKVRYDLQGNTGESYVPLGELEFSAPTPTPPAGVEIGSAGQEWNNEYWTSNLEPKWEQLNPKLQKMWKEAHAANTLNQDLFDNLTRIHRNEVAAANRKKPQTGGQVAGIVSQGKVAPVVQGDVQAAQAKLDAEQAQTDAVKAERADKIAKAVEGHKIQSLRSRLKNPNLKAAVREQLQTELDELEAKNLNYDDVRKEIQEIEDDEDFFQVTEGEAYPPINDQFPISREDFGRGLGITRHSKTWLATAYNPALAEAVTKGDMPAVIRALMDSTNPIVRDIAQRAKVLQQFVPLHRIKIKIADEELREEDALKGYRPGSIAGMFDEGTNTILVNSAYVGTEHTIAHELVHGLSERLLRTAQGDQLKAVNRLKQLYRDVLAKAKSVYQTDDLKKLPYGFKTPSEFLAEGLSNPEFQYLLAALPHEGKTSMWTQFVRAIADLLGLKNPNALTELLDIYSALLIDGVVTDPIEATKSALIGPPPQNNSYPLAPDDLPDDAKVPPAVSTGTTSLPQKAVNLTTQEPANAYLKAATDSELYINAMDQVGRSALSLQPLWYIADTARKLGFKQIGAIETALRKAGAMKNTLLKRSSDFMTKALGIAKSDPAGKKAMDAFVNRASDLAIDVTRSKTPSPEFVKARPDAVNDYISLRAEYEKLHPKFQTLASELVDKYRQFRDDYFAALRKSINEQYQDDPVKSDKILSGLDEKYKQFNEAYTPFVRIGDYWITYVNPDTGKDVAESYTSLGAQKTRLDELKKEGIVYVQSFKQTDFRKFSYKSGPVNQFFDEIKGNVDKALTINKDDSPAVAERIREAREEMKERLYQASLLLHPEASMLRKFGLQRKGTLGYIEDTLAAFDHQAPIYATQISQVAYKGQIEHEIDMARQQNASNPDTKMSDIITHVAKIVYGVDTIRSDDPLNQIANNVNRLGFTFYMGFNPASALVNMLQTPTVMFPLLAGEFHGLGQLKIMNTLFSAMTKIIGGSLGGQTYGEKLVESAEAKIDAAVAKGKTRGEAIAALPEMERVFLSFRDQGILNAGDPSHDFGSVTKHGSGETSAFGKGTRAFTKYSAIMFQRAEAVNREAGALATYQLMKQRLSGKADMNDQEKYAEAIRKATDMVTRAHGDYQHGLAPKIFLSPAMRVIFMFKKFPAHMAALYVRLFKDMFSDVDPEVRKVARIQFAGLMGMSALFAGTMGMPFYFIVRDMMNLMLDDEDDPYDFDFAFYNYLSDMWGQPMANRITRGWLGDLGGDVASKVGYASSPLLGGTKQLPFIGGLLGLRDGKTTASAEDDLKNYVAEAAGASAGMALQIARGVDKLAQGDVYRFLEGVTPMAGMRNIAKSIRLSNEGALTTRGEPIIEDVSLIESALQAVGFVPQRLAGQYQLNAWQKDAEKQILNRRQSLINQKFNARARGDYDTEADVNEEIQNFNAANPEKGLKITSETLAASARTRAQQSKDTKAGIYLSKPFRQRFADVPVYAEE
jgi:hypothetical protein